MYLLVGIPLILISSLIESSLLTRSMLLHGTADIVMLVVIAWALHERTKGAWIWAIIAGITAAFYTALPFYIPVGAYLLTTWIAMILHKRIWQAPLLMMMVITIFGTLFYQGVAMLILAIQSISFSIANALTQILLPSILLNLLWSLPIYGLITLIANRLYPQKDE